MERKPDIRMSYKTLLSLPDSKEKYKVLDRKLLKLQWHGTDFFTAMEECNRLRAIYTK